MGKLWLLICVVFLQWGTVRARAEEVLPPSRATYILAKVEEGDARCSQIALTATIETEVAVGTKGGPPIVTKRITERPVALCAYSDATKSWHVIHVHLQYPVPRSYVNCVRSALTLLDRTRCPLPFHVVTPGYQAVHLRGYGITRLIFDVYKDEVVRIRHGDETEEMHTRGEKLTVYRTRHMWFDDEALASGDADRIVATATAKNYTPDHPDLSDADLVGMGARYLFEAVRRVRGELGRDVRLPQTVRSHAFPDLALANAVPWETPMALAIIEQIDDKTFIFDKKKAIESVLREYAINRTEAFKWSQSSESAIGPLQFTNANGNGTYSAMVRDYPGALLDPSFQTGARDLGNALKASIAYIDQLVEQFPEAKLLYTKNPKLGGAIPVASYNAGPTGGRALLAWLKKNRISIEKQNIVFPSSLVMVRTEKCPCKDQHGKKGKKQGTVVHYIANTETPGYLAKYLYILNYLADLGLE